VWCAVRRRHELQTVRVTMCVPPRIQGRSFSLRSDKLFTTGYTHVHIFSTAFILLFVGIPFARICVYIFILLLRVPSTSTLTAAVFRSRLPRRLLDAARPLIRKRRSIARALPAKLPPPIKFVFIQLVFRLAGKFVHRHRIQYHKGS